MASATAAKAKRLVLVGSKNPVKVRAVASAFEQCSASAAFGPLEFVGVSAPSGVSDQPMGGDETRAGARNRARHCIALVDSHGGAGRVAFCVGLEGGLRPSSCGGGGDEEEEEDGGLLECFAWMAIFGTESGRWGWAQTASLVLPPAVCMLVRKGMELGEANDQIFGRSNSKQDEGAVGILSKGVIDRTEYLRHALVLALVPFLNSELYYPQESTS